ncbi:MAG: hypothetical protein K8R35_11380 [Bacteroidales bacterium]|nr:hypothetical protein [Bacteroidales bacterium]
MKETSDFSDKKLSCIDALDLASYIEGNKSKDEVQVIENHLAQCSECLDELLELQILLNAEIIIPPKEIVENAKSLINKTEIIEQQTIIKLPVWLNNSYYYVKSYIGYAAAIIILVSLSIGGIKMGVNSFNNHNKIKATCISEMTFELDNDTYLSFNASKK